MTSPPGTPGEPSGHLKPGLLFPSTHMQGWPALSGRASRRRTAPWKAHQRAGPPLDRKSRRPVPLCSLGFRFHISKTGKDHLRGIASRIPWGVLGRVSAICISHPYDPWYITWVPPGNFGIKPNQEDEHKNKNVLPPVPLFALLPSSSSPPRSSYSDGKNSHSTRMSLPHQAPFLSAVATDTGP